MLWVPKGTHMTDKAQELQVIRDWLNGISMLLNHYNLSHGLVSK